jgi:DNA-binding transcriptional LysR family regulator
MGQRTVTLNLLHLATLHEFVRRGTLAAAADELGYTPGAASQHIASLERELGTAVLAKAGRHLVLTDAGRVLAEHAEDLLEGERRARLAVASVSREVSGPVVVGIWGSSAAALLGPLLGLVADRYPGLEVTSREVPVDLVTQSVRTRDVDLAFGLDYPEDPIPRERNTTVRPLLRERFWVAAVGPGRRRTRARSLAELSDRPWILPSPTTVMGHALRVAFRRVGVEPHVVHEVDDSAASLHLAAQGLGHTLATDLMQRLAHDPALDRVPLREEVVREVVLVSPESAASRAISAVASLAEEVVSQPFPRARQGRR